MIDSAGGSVPGSPRQLYSSAVQYPVGGVGDGGMGGYAVTININLRDKRKKKKKKKKTDQAAPSQPAAGREGSAAAGMPGTPPCGQLPASFAVEEGDSFSLDADPAPPPAPGSASEAVQPRPPSFPAGSSQSNPPEAPLLASGFDDLPTPVFSHHPPVREESTPSPLHQAAATRVPPAYYYLLEQDAHGPPAVHLPGGRHFTPGAGLALGQGLYRRPPSPAPLRGRLQGQGLELGLGLGLGRHPPGGEHRRLSPLRHPSPGGVVAGAPAVRRRGPVPAPPGAAAGRCAACGTTLAFAACFCHSCGRKVQHQQWG
ncbi:hypothetical protein DIPPA_17830 [Diplonema papillatum]|nr:hypothetical protein DIPPA_17830 [Diplonema papillatum]